MSDQYRVIGPVAIYGVQPGEIVRLDESVNIPALIEAGHVELVPEKKPSGSKAGKRQGGSDDGVQPDGRDDSGQ